MPKRKRVQREHREEWQIIWQETPWPEQTTYELFHPIVLLVYPAIQRAKETDEPHTSLERRAEPFDRVSLFASRLNVLEMPGKQSIGDEPDECSIWLSEDARIRFFWNAHPDLWF